MHNWYITAQEDALLKEAGVREYVLLTLLNFMSGTAVGADANSIRNFLSSKNISEEKIMEMVDKSGQPIENLTKSDIARKTNKQFDSSMPSFDELRNLMAIHEGVKTKVYPDPILKWEAPTIGIGHNLKKPSSKQLLKSLGLNYEDVISGKKELTKHQIDKIFESDLTQAINDASGFVNNFNVLPKEAKTVLIDMAFNMGITRLNKFVKFKTALENEDFSLAAREMKNSNWYNQVGNRGKALVALIQKLNNKDIQVSSL